MMLHEARHRAELEQQQAQAILAEKSRALLLLDGIAQNSTDAIFAKDREGHYLLFNRAASRIVGKPTAEVLGKDDTTIFPPEQAVTVMADDRKVMESGRVITYEHKLSTTQGETVFSTTQGPLQDTDGEVVGVFGIARDITALKSVERNLRNERDLNQRYLDTVQTIMVALDDEGRITMLNRYGCELLGYSEKELLGENWFRKCLPQPEGMEITYPVFRQILGGHLENVEHFENAVLCHDGAQKMIAWRNGYLKNAVGNILGVLSSGEDITARMEAEAQLRKLSQAVEQSPECIVITNLDARIEYVNEAFTRTSGYSREELVGQNPRIHQSGKTPKETYDALWASLGRGDIWQGELYNKRKDGAEYTVHAIISPIRQTDGRITHYVAVEADITEKQLNEAEIHRLAFYDPLTGLPNRVLLLERMTQTLATTHRAGHYSALISYNLDRFKTYNDAGGQVLGDALLTAVGKRLLHALREGDVVARIAGDEFGILLTDLAPQQQSAAHYALHVAEKLHAALHKPVSISDESFSLTACLGIALLPGSEEDNPLDILRRANTALHHAKTRGNGQTAFFEGALDDVSRHRYDIERELHQAIAAGELRLFLQPQMTADGRIVGAEALVRWQHPQRGLIQPGAFIPVAEESNLIIEIGSWVFAEVCRLLTRDEFANRPIRIAVNISPRHFRQDDFVDQVKRMLQRTGADPIRLTLEVTEGMLIDNINDVVAKMVELGALGIHFSLDDFGTGYSSLSYLKRLPIHEIKIDKTFVQDMTTDANDASLVETILLVAQHMRLKVVAEGVETEEQAAFLNQRGTVIHQGYLFGRPEPAETMLPILSQGSR